MLEVTAAIKDRISAFGLWVLDIDMFAFVILVTMSSVFAVLLFVTAYRKLRAYRVVVDTPTARIRSAPQGYTEIKGEFMPLDPGSERRTPFSNKPCLWYRAWIQEQRGSDKNRRWVTIFEEVDPRPCRLRDDTGECLVLPGAASMRLATVTESWCPGSWFGKVPEPLTMVDRGLLSRKLRFNEERVVAGPGYAIGRFTTSNGEAGGPEEVVELCNGWRTDYMGEIKGRPDRQRPNPEPGSWNPLDVPHAIARWARERGYADGPVHVLGATDESRRPFIVGVGDEEVIARRLCWTWIGCSVGFLIAGTIAIALLSARGGLLS